MPTNHEKLYETLVPRLADLDAPVTIRFLGRDFLLTRAGVEQISGPAAHINMKNLLIWYVSFSTRGDESAPLTASATPETATAPALCATPASPYDFRPLHAFSFGIFSSQNVRWQQEARSHFHDLTLERFKGTCERLGAVFIKPERYGESWLLEALLRLPVLLSFSEADEEFPAQLDAKFAANATEVLPFESLAVLQGLVLAEFV